MKTQWAAELVLFSHTKTEGRWPKWTSQNAHRGAPVTLAYARNLSQNGCLKVSPWSPFFLAFSPADCCEDDETDDLEDVGVDDRIILKLILENKLFKGVDWINLVQDRDRWRALVSTVTNFRVPSREGDFLNNLAYHQLFKNHSSAWSWLVIGS